MEMGLSKSKPTTKINAFEKNDKIPPLNADSLYFCKAGATVFVRDRDLFLTAFREWTDRYSPQPHLQRLKTLAKVTGCLPTSHLAYSWPHSEAYLLPPRGRS